MYSSIFSYMYQNEVIGIINRCIKLRLIKRLQIACMVLIFDISRVTDTIKKSHNDTKGENNEKF